MKITNFNIVHSNNYCHYFMFHDNCVKGQKGRNMTDKNKFWD